MSDTKVPDFQSRELDLLVKYIDERFNAQDKILGMVDAKVTKTNGSVIDLYDRIHKVEEVHALCPIRLMSKEIVDLRSDQNIAKEHIDKLISDNETRKGFRDGVKSSNDLNKDALLKKYHIMGIIGIIFAILATIMGISNHFSSKENYNKIEAVGQTVEKNTGYHFRRDGALIQGLDSTNIVKNRDIQDLDSINKK